jgi:subtilisin family serine protease
MATVVLLSALLAVQMLSGTAMAESTYKHPDQPSQAPIFTKKEPKRIPKRSTLAPLINEDVPNRIPDQYIVIFKPGTSIDVALAAQKKVIGLRGTIRTTYTSGLIGFSAELSEDALQLLRSNPSVDYIEVNQMGQLNTAQPPNPNSPPPTGLARTSKRLLPLPNPLSYTYSETGAGVHGYVHVYVIDTGIRATHTEFGGRVSGGINVDTMTASDTGDCNAHGTQVAGIIGGAIVGIAKEVALHPIRANGAGTSGSGCGDTTLDRVIKAVDWITTQKNSGTLQLPAVVNLSSSFATDPALDTAVQASITTGITYVLAAGNYSKPTNSPENACNSSPARINMSNPNKAIVVGAIDPTTDTRWSETKVRGGGVTYYVGSNVGPCLSLFAPGVGISTAFPINDTSVQPAPPGTSFAAAHVTGIVARILNRNQNPPTTPEAVWCAMHLANNTDGPRQGVICSPEPTPTANWQGVTDRVAGSPNEMLHNGSRNNGIDDGDPHITTVNGIHYDFQAGGEFVALRDANGLEIQTRQTPVPGAEHVSINTAIAARVDKHRVTWQPGPNGLQLRVDGALTPIGENGLDLGNGGRVMKSVAGESLEVYFPDETVLIVTSHWWEGQSQSYLTVQVFNTPAMEGIMGAIEPGSWLQPEFAETWRVTNETSLFDYAPSLSTKTFTRENFPKENIPPVNSEVLALARRVCESIADPAIADHNMLADCAFDMAVTGDPIFAKSLRIDQMIQRGATNTTVTVDRNLNGIREEVTLTATVIRHGSEKGVPTGRVAFILDGKEVGKPVTLDSNGQAQLKMSSLRVGSHRVTAKYIPDKDSVFLPSSSLDKHHTVEKRQIRHRGTSPKNSYEK